MEKKMEYMESYYSLSHGTDNESAKKICSEGFQIKGESSSWCGPGAYFYDIKAKAWWAANRKCEEIKKETGKKVKPYVVYADIENIPKKDIFDLRVKADLEAFEEFAKPILLGEYKINVSAVEDDKERVILLRAMLISFYADKEKRKLVIGNFKQRPQPLYEHVIEFANSLDMIFGIETIYCVKDNNIISNICLGGSK
jgi:hypothetical protein